MTSQQSNENTERVKIVRKRLASGEIREYRYQLDKEPASPYPNNRAIGFLANLYFASPEFTRVSQSWQKEIRWYLSLIDGELDFLSVPKLCEKGMKQRLYQLRDKYADVPAKADRIIAVLRQLLNWAVEREHIAFNVATRIDPLVSKRKNRAEFVWEPEHQAEFLSYARDDVCDAFTFSLYTVMRQGDLLSLPRQQFDGEWLVYKPGKTKNSTGVTLHIPIFRLTPLRELVNRLPQGQYMLTPHDGRTKGTPWTKSNLQRLFYEARDEALAKNQALPWQDLHWHDLRGTGISMLMDAGCTHAETAAISGHSLAGDGDGGRAATMTKYIKRTRQLALNAYTKLDNYLAAKGGDNVVPLRAKA